MKITLKKLKRVILNILLDVGSMFACLTILSLIKYFDKIEKLVDFNIVFGSYLLLILIVSLFFDKYEINKRYGFYRTLNKYLFSWIITSTLIISMLIILELDYYRWISVLISFIFLLIFELFLISIRFSFRYAKFVGEKNQMMHLQMIRDSFIDEEVKEEFDEEKYEDHHYSQPSLVKSLLSPGSILNPELRQFIRRNSTENPEKHVYINTSDRQVFLPYKNNSLELIVNIKLINYVRFLNKFFEVINIKLKRGAKLIVCVETLKQRRDRHNKKFPKPLHPFIRFMEFMVHRVWPRMPLLRKLYFMIWKKNSKRISYAETLGRLYSCGFEYVEELIIDGKTWIVMRKKERPLLSFDVTYSPLVKLKRVGKGGKLIFVYKMRTMHPYSEFLQDFIYKKNKLSEGGKFKDDFRVSALGKFFRKIWLDELPMLLNLLKGDLKIVGVRPLSQHYFSLYPHEVQEKRIKYKPGLIPPFYVDLPTTFDEIVESETRYLDKYEKSPIKTDFIYFWKALGNILFKKARSG